MRADVLKVRYDKRGFTGSVSYRPNTIKEPQ